jgi:outer membrane protein OmpA-like peptidoglycan-associated protein
MKHILVLCLLLAAPSLFALDGVFAGLGAEANAETREGFAAGGGLTLGFDINESFAAGVKGFFSSNFDTVSTLETAAFFRWYLPLPVKGFFIQADLGGSFIFEDGENYPVFLGGLSAGWRYVFKNNLYIEAAVRGGYPFVWGAGLSVGYRFNLGGNGSEENNSEVMANREALAAEITAMLQRQQVADTTARATGEGVMITLSDIQFEANSSELPASEKQKLQEIANILNNIPARKILVAGHTADTGNRRGELNVSRQRAWAVADYLVELGSRTHGEVAVTGYGASRPVADNTTPEGMAANRRVEITILGNW